MNDLEGEILGSVSITPHEQGLLIRKLGALKEAMLVAAGPGGPRKQLASKNAPCACGAVIDHWCNSARLPPSDTELADALIARLNGLLDGAGTSSSKADPPGVNGEAWEVRQDIQKLLEVAVPASQSTIMHDTIQVSPNGGLRFLGLLNGAIGTVGRWPNAPGYIAVVYEGERLVRFQRANVPKDERNK